MTRHREVWKIGGSVLRSPADYIRCAAQISDHLKRNPELDRLYVVISAGFGITDRLVRQAARGQALERLHAVLHGKAACSEVGKLDTSETALHLLQGELDSVHALRSALASRGVQAKSSTQCDFFPITASGSFLRADYLQRESFIRFKLFEQICQGQRLVILSGFGGVNLKNQPVILGRNASDYVASLLTQLDPGITSATFIKESGAVFENFETPRQRPLSEISSEDLWQDQFEELLDRRVLTSITCDFRVCGLDLSGGTMVHRSADNAAVVAAHE